MFFEKYPEIHEITSKYGYTDEIYTGEDDKYIVIQNNKHIELMISIAIENKVYTMESSNEYLFYHINTIQTNTYYDPEQP